MPRRRPVRTLVLGGAAAAALVLSSCAGDASGGAQQDGTLDVIASFYPLQFAATRVGGDTVTVSNLTKPGAEPHDLELTPADVGAIADADLVVFLHGFQPAVDDAVETEAADTSYDVEQDARLDLAATEDDHGHEGEEHAGDEHADEEHADGAGSDPHFWLDPMRLADVGDALAERLATLDEANADTYRSNADDLRADLESLDEEISTGLADCTSTEIVTSHESFGYLAERYGFEQLGITGLSPEEEPSPQDLAEVTEFVREHSVSTIYYETLISPDVARTVADETGASTAVLDPIEGLTDESAAEDYLGVMRANLQALREGQSCT